MKEMNNQNNRRPPQSRQRLLWALLASTPNNMAKRKANGDFVVRAATKNEKHRIMDIV